MREARVTRFEPGDVAPWLPDQSNGLLGLT
jgi:hypothetical protein